MEIKITGADELQAKFDELRAKYKELDNKIIPIDELFPDSFIQQHTTALSLSEFFKQSGFIINSKEDFLAIPDDKWEKYITENTKFESWIEMQRVAQEAWLKKWLKDNKMV
ncbi:hypothetical protein ACNVED_13280 [Legionella sp. D16C41]|uniref:hypothetical protein n=1 Tax=Legionella sp. D16C41 TaxID=3402688 RepID=UPI003AF8CD48